MTEQVRASVKPLVEQVREISSKSKYESKYERVRKIQIGRSSKYATKYARVLARQVRKPPPMYYVLGGVRMPRFTADQR